MSNIKTFSPKNNGLIVQFETNEFSAICPFDNNPDVYTLIIEYKAGNKCVESDSLYKWLLSFRNKKISAEDLTGEIAYELNEILNPYWIEVTLKQSIRSTLQLTVKTKIGE